MPDFEITYSAEEIINYADKEMLLVKKCASNNVNSLTAKFLA